MSDTILMKSSELSVLRWAKANCLNPEEWLNTLLDEIQGRYLAIFVHDRRRVKSMYLTYKRLCEVIEEDFAISCANIDVDGAYAMEFIETVYGHAFLPKCRTVNRLALPHDESKVAENDAERRKQGIKPSAVFAM